MIIGIGIDLCEVPRIERALQNTGFLERFFTETERAYLRDRGKGMAQSAAGHFAAKEAGLKALGCGIAFSLQDISVEHDALGAPKFCLTGEALARMRELGGASLHLSITHTDGVAAAVAVLEGAT